MYSNRFGCSFVSSGSTGGDQSQRATIVAPKQQGQRPAVPAPVPVTERPLFNRPGGLGAAAYQASTHQVGICMLPFSGMLHMTAVDFKAGIEYLHVWRHD